jgi:excisionase family DNA binding protein
MDSLIGIKELAEMLGVSVRHIHRMKASGQLPRPVYVGRSVKYQRSKLQQWMDNGGTHGKQPSHGR